MSDTVLGWGLVAAFLVAGITAIVVMNWFRERHRRRKWASGKLAKGASAGGATAAAEVAAVGADRVGIHPIGAKP